MTDRQQADAGRAVPVARLAGHAAAAGRAGRAAVRHLRRAAQRHGRHGRLPRHRLQPVHRRRRRRQGRQGRRRGNLRVRGITAADRLHAGRAGEPRQAAATTSTAASAPPTRRPTWSTASTPSTSRPWKSCAPTRPRRRSTWRRRSRRLRERYGTNAVRPGRAGGPAAGRGGRPLRDRQPRRLGHARPELRRPARRSCCRTLDQTLSALIQDLSDRGMLDSTIVYCAGEFGRTPKINKNAGRDHWARSMAVVLAGGGFKARLRPRHAPTPRAWPRRPKPARRTTCRRRSSTAWASTRTPSCRPRRAGRSSCSARARSSRSCWRDARLGPSWGRFATCLSTRQVANLPHGGLDDFLAATRRGASPLPSALFSPRTFLRSSAESLTIQEPAGPAFPNEECVAMSRRGMLPTLILLALAGPAFAAGPPSVFQAPRRPDVPAVRNKSWCVNPIDAFILARLEAAGVEPSPPAGKLRLLRRVTFDLTGLPPTLDEQDAFLKDDSPDAYEKVVDRLLACRTTASAGDRLARPGALRRDRRLQGRRPAARSLPLPRLRHPQLQRRPALRPLRPPAARRRRAGAGQPGCPHRHRLPPPLARRVQRRQPGAAAPGNPRRRDRHGRPGLPRPDVRLRPLPRPQVRPDPAEGLLPPPGVLRPDAAARRPAGPRRPGAQATTRRSSRPGKKRRRTSATRWMRWSPASARRRGRTP